MKNNFIEKSTEIHGNKYDYSLVEYKNNRTKVKIICPIHGIFEQVPDKHKNRKRGCPKCGGTSKLTTEDFINKSKEIYGDKYDYSLTEYVDAHTKVKIIYNGEIFEQIPSSHLKGHMTSKINKNEILKMNFIKKSNKIHNNKYDYSLVDYKNTTSNQIKIICPIHGIFEQFPISHLDGIGCFKCKHQEIFISKSNILYDNKYDYHLVKYIDNYTKVKIICPIHGIFEQTPKNHYKNGCKKCSDNNKRYTTEEFIEKCKNIYGDKYDYSLTKYIGTYDKVRIICPEHGEFEIRPNDHLNDRGCRKCGNYTKGSNRLNTKIFIEKSKKIHGDKYDYSMVDYKNNGYIKVSIICKKHGSFKQKPHNHLNGNGCPKCNESKGEKEIRLFLNNKNINFINQKSFDDCRDVLPLPFDFYLPEYNTCIEYDGIQHFEIVENWGGEDGLKDRQKKIK